MKTLAELDEKRRLAMLQDFRGVLVRAKAGDLGGAQSLLQDRLQVLNEIGGDPSHSAEVLRYLQEGRADEAIAGLQSIDDIAVARGELPSLTGEMKIQGGQAITAHLGQLESGVLCFLWVVAHRPRLRA
jgi:hypothetical protein